jgi:rRNA-processing protein FCF1
MKVMFDTQIYDLVIAELGMTQTLNSLATKGVLKILTTHIQQGEIQGIPNEEKRRMISEIITECVTTSGAVYGVSVYNMATYGDGNTGGFGIDDVRSKTGGHTNDALIATTASRDADVLVTEDKRLANRLKQLNTQTKVWLFADLKQYLSDSKQDRE